MIELKKRNQQRDNRPEYLTDQQFHKVHEGFLYDFRINTTQKTAIECANELITAMTQCSHYYGIRYTK